MIHAGFSADNSETGLDYSQGTISAVVVKPEHRRHGIARQLVQKAEEYLEQRGAQEIVAGAGLNRNGFYHAIYGGLEPAGFAESAAAWTPFFASCGYEPAEVTHILHRDLSKGRDPVNARLIRNRRRLQMVITDRIPTRSWWWYARFGHQDTLQFQLNERGSGDTVATGHILGLDIYIPKWGVRAVGIRDIFVPEEGRRQGYAFSLVMEMCRQLRGQSIRVVEAQVDSENAAAMDLFTAARFEIVENLVTFRRSTGR